MNAFLDALGKKAAEQWFSLLVLPGVLWVATAAVAAHLGQHDPLNLSVVANWLNDWASRAKSPVVLSAVFVAMLLAGAGAGATATGLGALARRCWLMQGRRRPLRWLVSWRRLRWDHAQRTVHDAVTDAVGAAKQPTDQQVVAGPEVAQALARRDATALERPEHPTWIGDRWRAAVVRTHRAYSLDLNVAWPRLWSVLPEHLRTDLETAHASYVSAGTLIGWAVLYAALGPLWWPALLIGVALTVAGVVRARTSTETQCVLVETAVDLHCRTLAEHLGHDAGTGSVSHETGSRISALMRKDY